MLNTLKVYIKINICTIHLIGWHWIFEVLYALHDGFIASHFISIVFNKRRIKTTIPIRKQSFYLLPLKNRHNSQTNQKQINGNIDISWLLIYFTIYPIRIKIIHGSHNLYNVLTWITLFSLYYISHYRSGC